MSRNSGRGTTEMTRKIQLRAREARRGRRAQYRGTAGAAPAAHVAAPSSFTPVQIWLPVGPSRRPPRRWRQPGERLSAPGRHLATLVLAAFVLGRREARGGCPVAPSGVWPSVARDEPMSVRRRPGTATRGLMATRAVMVQLNRADRGKSFRLEK